MVVEDSKVLSVAHCYWLKPVIKANRNQQIMQTLGRGLNTNAIPWPLGQEQNNYLPKRQKWAGDFRVGNFSRFSDEEMANWGQWTVEIKGKISEDYHKRSSTIDLTITHGIFLFPHWANYFQLACSIVDGACVLVVYFSTHFPENSLSLIKWSLWT